MAVANLPATTSQSAPPAADEALLETLADAIAAGHAPAAIARKLGGDDPAKRKHWRSKIHRYLREDQRLAVALAGRAREQMLVDLVPTTKAMGQRARRGRVDAGKLILEASGFHNPRVKHEHSGDIKITLDMPRPRHLDEDTDFVDAEVVP